jgi:hypothetical protein
MICYKPRKSDSTIPHAETVKLSVVAILEQDLKEAASLAFDGRLIGSGKLCYEPLQYSLKILRAAKIQVAANKLGLVTICGGPITYRRLQTCRTSNARHASGPSTPSHK